MKRGEERTDRHSVCRCSRNAVRLVEGPELSQFFPWIPVHHAEAWVVVDAKPAPSEITGCGTQMQKPPAGSALDKVAKKLVNFGFFAGVIFLGNRARLSAQLQAENLILQ